MPQGGGDRVVSSAAAEIDHRGSDLLLTWLWALLQQSGRRHYLSRLAIPALWDLVRHPRLHDAAANGVLIDGFDRGNGHPGDTLEAGDAGSGGLAIDQDGTSTALSDAAAIFRACHAQLVADDPEQWRIGLRFHLMRLAIDRHIRGTAPRIVRSIAHYFRQRGFRLLAVADRSTAFYRLAKI